MKHLPIHLHCFYVHSQTLNFTHRHLQEAKHSFITFTEYQTNGKGYVCNYFTNIIILLHACVSKHRLTIFIIYIIMICYMFTYHQNWYVTNNIMSFTQCLILHSQVMKVFHLWKTGYVHSHQFDCMYQLRTSNQFDCTFIPWPIRCMSKNSTNRFMTIKER